MAKSYAIKDACKDFGKLFGHEIVKRNNGILVDKNLDKEIELMI
jgi:hypothetical protein